MIIGYSLFQIASLRVEDQLLLACAQPSIDAMRHEKILRLLETTSTFDWSYLLAKARRHRLNQLLYCNLQQVAPQLIPPNICATLQSEFKAIALHNHYLLGQLIGIIRLLQNADIVAIPYKGPVLAQQVYGDVALRVFSDLDLYIPRKYRAKVIKVLTENNFKLVYSYGSQIDLVCILANNETTFINSSSGLNIDINWKPEGLFRWLDSNFEFEDYFGNFVAYNINSLPIMTFTPEDLLLVLCLHVARHYWQNLIWVGDIVALIQKYPNLMWDKVINKAKMLGILQIVGINISLADLLFELNLPANIIQRLEIKKRIVALVHTIARNIFYAQDRPYGFFRKIYFFLAQRDAWWLGVRDVILFQFFFINARFCRVDPALRTNKMDQKHPAIKFLFIYYLFRWYDLLRQLFRNKNIKTRG